MSSNNQSLVLQIKAEDYTPKILDRIDITIDPLYSIYKLMINEVVDLINGNKNFSSIYIEGLYGTGKTLLLRKFAHDVVNGSDAEKILTNVSNIEKIIPIYFYLGVGEFLPYNKLGKYIDDIKTYLTTDISPTTVIGKKDAWPKRLEILESCYEESAEAAKIDETTAFFEALKCINKKGYKPLVIFDEFERLVYTGESLRTDSAIKAFVEFSKKYLELTRGQIYNGAFIIATTSSIRELVSKALMEGRPHIFKLADQLGIPREQLTQQFPLLSPNIVYDIFERINWHKTYLELLAKRYNLIIHTDILEVISQVLPTPRAIIQISRKISPVFGRKNVVSLKDFFQIIRDKIDEFMRRLVNEKIDGKWIVPPQAKWHERFYKLVENGYYVITRDKYLTVASVLEVKAVDERKIRQKVNNILQKLYKIGLYYRQGPGAYMLNPYILAYALGIERLPTGEESNLENLLANIKQKIKELREASRHRRTGS
jgi:hypothetical protein